MLLKKQLQHITGGFDLVKFGNYDWQTTLASILNPKEIKPLKDVEFSVYSDATGKVVQKGFTDKEGYLKFTDLPYDTYTVKETKTPIGYVPAKDFKVTIREQNETHHYAIENKVIEEKLKVVKVDGSNNGLIEIRFEDMSQKGIANFTKTGQTPIGVATKESDYGLLHEYVYDYTPIADVTYPIEAVYYLT